MSTKIIFNKYIGKRIVIDEICISDENVKLEQINIPEYSGLEVELLTENEDSYIEFEYIYGYIDGIVRVRQNDRKKIFDREVVEHDLVPGRYKYKYYDGNRIHEGIYWIKSSAIEWKDLLQLRTYLNEYLENLALNIYKKNRIYGEDIELSNNILVIKTNLENNHNNILTLLREICNNPMEDIKKEYVKSSSLRNIDSKIQRDLLEKSNWNSLNSKVKRSQLILRYNSDENVLLKKIIENIIKKILQVELSLKIEIDQYKVIIGEKEKKLFSIKNKEKEVRDFERWIEASNSELKTYNMKIRIFNEEIKKIRNKIELLNGDLIYFKKFRLNIINIVEMSILKNININSKKIIPTYKFFADGKYLNLYLIYKSLILDKNQDGNKFKVNYMAKDTPTLFEYYSFLMVLQVVESLDFVWENGWLADKLDAKFIPNYIPEEEEMIFINYSKGLKIKLCYGKRIGEGDYLYRNKISDFVRVNEHYNPDITLAILDNDTNKFMDGIIIEAKCYKERNLQPKEGSKVTKQLESYMLLNYNDPYGGKEKTITKSISKVIVTYPMANPNNEITFDRYENKIYYIPLKINGDNIENHFGFKEIRDEILKSLEQIPNMQKNIVGHNIF